MQGLNPGCLACELATLPLCHRGRVAVQAALLQYNKGIELLRDISVITEFESSIRGGFTSVVKGKATFNNKYLNDFDPNKPISTGISLWKLI